MFLLEDRRKTKRKGDNLKLQLFSDYSDFYDPFFESKYELVSGSLKERTDFSGEVKPFCRYAGLGHGISKTEQFKQLKRMNFAIIPNFECWNLEFSKDKKVVVYLDEFAHSGNGKILVTPREARNNYPDYRCSLFLRTHKDFKKSRLYKRIFIGNHQFDFRITCQNEPEDPDSWGTNNAINMNIVLLNHKKCENNYRPIYGIDFIQRYFNGKYQGDKYAIDLNWAPGLHGLKINEIFSGKEIVELITNWCEEKNWKSRKE